MGLCLLFINLLVVGTAVDFFEGKTDQFRVKKGSH
jgi:hypothetical protein